MIPECLIDDDDDDSYNGHCNGFLPWLGPVTSAGYELTKSHGKMGAVLEPVIILMIIEALVQNLDTKLSAK